MYSPFIFFLRIFTIKATRLKLIFNDNVRLEQCGFVVLGYSIDDRYSQNKDVIQQKVKTSLCWNKKKTLKRSIKLKLAELSKLKSTTKNNTSLEVCGYVFNSLLKDKKSKFDQKCHKYYKHSKEIHKIKVGKTIKS